MSTAVTFRSGRDRRAYGATVARNSPSGPLVGGQGDLCLNSLEIDRTLARFKDMPACTAEFSRILSEQPETAKAMLLSIRSTPFIIPFHCDHHWIPVVVFHNATLYADSAPSASHDAHVQKLHALLLSLGFAGELINFRCPRQPAASNQCGVHLIVNALAMAYEESIECDGTLDYNFIRVSIRGVADGIYTPKTILRRARTVSTMSHLQLFRPMSRGQVTTALDELSASGPTPFFGPVVVFASREGSTTLHTSSITPVRRTPAGWVDAKGALVFSGVSVLSICRDIALLFSHDRGPLPLWGGADPSPLSHEVISERLRGAHVGDMLRVVFLEDGVPTAWVGALTQKHFRHWSICYDLGAEVLRGIIPNPEVEYLMVEVNPLAVGNTAPLPPPPALTANVAPSPPSPAPSPTPSTAAPLAQPRASAPASVDFQPAVTANPPPARAPTAGLRPTAASTAASAAAPGLAAPLSATATPFAPIHGTGIAELDSMYEDLLLPKNAVLPQSVLRRSGDQITARELVLICSEREKEPHPMHRFNTAASTAKAHKRTLRWIAANLPPTDETVDSALPECIFKKGAAANWLPSSLITRLCATLGALTAIFLYRPQQIYISLGCCPAWRAALKSAQRMKPLQQPNQPKAATEEEILDAMAKEPRPEVRAGIEIGFLAAARGGDIRQVLANDIKFPPVSPSEPTPTMIVTFRRGKTAQKEQYAVGVPLPSQETVDFIKARQLERSWAFPGLQGKDLMVALRRANPRLEQRSLRRGRLQHLANRGWTDAQLIELSRHASIPMLRRYLDMGVVSATTRETAVRAATASTSL